MGKAERGEAVEKIKAFGRVEREQKRKLTRARRLAWFQGVATDALSNMLGALMAGGIAVLFGSLFGAIHGLSAAQLAAIASGVVSLLLLSIGGASAFGVFRFTADAEKTLAELHRGIEETMERQRRREEEIRQMEEEGTLYPDDADRSPS